MLAELIAALAPREERITLAGHALVVRELAVAADVSAMQDNVDLTWKLVVRCVFDEAGAAVFTDADIPALKAGSKARLQPLINAVVRVNGMDIEAEAKNSPAAPA